MSSGNSAGGGIILIDIAVIGAGPAGLSAAVNAAARNRTVTVFGNKPETSAIYKAESVNNHLGMPGVSGKEMLGSFFSHAKSTGVEILEGRVFQIMQNGSSFTINFENEFFESTAVILATGVSKGKKIKGEDEYLGLGVSYCATCDGMLYRGKDVIVVGETSEGDEDANFLSGICNTVLYLPLHGKPEGLSDKVRVMSGAITEVVGGEYVTGIKTEDKLIACDGVFFIKKNVPLSSLINGLATVESHITVNRLAETSLDGVFACGDCTGWPYQISSAIGEGLIAAQQADRYISAKGRT